VCFDLPRALFALHTGSSSASPPRGGQTAGGGAGFLSSAWNFVQSAGASEEEPPGAAATRAAQLQAVRAALRDQAWVWVNAHFAVADRVAFSKPQGAFDCSPYLEVLSADYQPFRALFDQCGVRAQFELRARWPAVLLRGNGPTAWGAARATTRTS